jgi:hypothetical protein
MYDGILDPRVLANLVTNIRVNLRKTKWLAEPQLASQIFGFIGNWTLNSNCLLIL